MASVMQLLSSCFSKRPVYSGCVKEYRESRLHWLISHQELVRSTIGMIYPSLDGLAIVWSNPKVLVLAGARLSWVGTSVL